MARTFHITAEMDSTTQMPGHPVFSQLCLPHTPTTKKFRGNEGYFIYVTVFIHNCQLNSYMVIVPTLSLGNGFKTQFIINNGVYFRLG